MKEPSPLEKICENCNNIFEYNNSETEIKCPSCGQTQQPNSTKIDELEQPQLGF
jgi:predicted RNA-binding Zn-ribbon protein involved in translation (DUF1610 family)